MVLHFIHFTKAHSQGIARYSYPQGESAVISVHRNASSVVCTILLSLIATPLFASGASIDKAALVGSWDYTTYTMLKKGKPVGTIQFKPRSMVFTYNDDGTWQMQADDATHTHRNGTYELLHGSELVLKNPDGSGYQDFQLEMRSDGRFMLLRDNKSALTAEKLNSSQ